jgi:DNA-binding XRE family transcriptional regulator
VVEAVRPKRDQSVDIDDLVADLEQDPELKAELALARQWVGQGIVEADRPTLRSLRLRAGLTQAQLASGVGLRQPNISSFEAGQRVPSVPTLRRLAKVLNVSTDELLASLDR